MMKNQPRPPMLAAVLLALCGGAVQAQSSCSSDGQPQPVALLERFINADCEACWSDARTVRPGAGALAIDWIVPGNRGDDAPLSAAASRDALDRLKALRRPVPSQAGSARAKVQGGSHRVRVAQGLPFNGYIGTSIELQPARAGPWKGWLLLVETVPAGSEGTEVERNLVRNTLQLAWGGERKLSKAEQERLFESRPMSIPEGAKAARLRVIGWVEDGSGRIRAIAQSRCVAPRSNE